MFGSALWGRGFRPFFLLAAAYAAAAVPLWVAVLAGWLAAPSDAAPMAWHAHEMLFGFAAAAIAGFLLTSVPVWTGSAPVEGARLAALAALWIAGRVAMWAPGFAALPRALIDGAFLAMVAAAIALPIAAARQRRNYGFPALVAGLALANALWHAEAAGLAAGALAVRIAVLLVALLVVAVGGRITPAFTRNALVRAGLVADVRSRPWLDRLAIASVVLLLAAEIAAPRTLASGAAAALACAAQAGRMAGWQPHRTLRDPLVWSLHLGYAWLAAGFGCAALADLTAVVAWTTAVHALTAGAFGTMIVAVTTRVALGHTGRPLAAPRGIAAAYLAVTLGAAVRVLGPALLPERALAWHALASLLWSGGYAAFLVVYAPILLRPRIDGAPG
jgi:uncharacterized protein involved in response to NO